MSNSAITAPTQFLQTQKEKYAYRRFGRKSKYPLLFLQHFTGTLDNWDPAVTKPLAKDHDIILFDNAGVGGSNGKAPTTMAGMAEHAEVFLNSLGIETCDVLGFSLGGVITQQMALDNSNVFRKMILVGTAPRDGEVTPSASP
jgi:pimeloyl-ACP methyl ester carboxylesterase